MWKWKRWYVSSCVGLASGCGGLASSDFNAHGREEAPVSWAEFLASSYKEPGPNGIYLVDGDVPIRDEIELREYYESWSDPSGALTVDQTFDADNVWDFTNRFELSYCVSDGFGDRKDDVEAAMAAATSSWHDIIGVRFTYVPEESASCDEANANVSFNVIEVADDGKFASAFFPDFEREKRELKLRPVAYTTTSGGRDFEGILRHEIGHALGFRHEHVWLTSSCTSETDENARLVTAYDENSVMHYPQCRTSGSGGYRQTDSDYAGAAELYGLSAPLVAVSTSRLL